MKKVLRAQEKLLVVVILQSFFQYIHNCSNHIHSTQAKYLCSSSLFHSYKSEESNPPTKTSCSDPNETSSSKREIYRYTERWGKIQHPALNWWGTSKTQQIVQVQEQTFSFASWHFLIHHGLFAENEGTILIFIRVCCLRN